MRSKPPDMDQLLNLTGLIYASAIEPGKTTDSLAALEEVLDMAGSQVYTFHRASGTILDSQMCAAVHRTLSDDYLNHWGYVDPRLPRLAGLPFGSAAACHDWFDERYVGGNAYYQEFLIPAGFRWATAGVFDAGDGNTTVVAGLRTPDQQPFEQDDVRLLSRLLPHFQRAGILRQRLQLSAASAAAAPDLVQHMPMPSFLIDDRGRVVLANDAFHRSLTRLPVRLAGSWLRFEQSRLQQEWHARLRVVFEYRCASTFEAHFANHQICRTHIVPWRAIAQRTDGAEQRLALVMMDEPPSSDGPSGFEECSTGARLTDAEREVLRLILQGHSAKSIARMRDVSRHTVRNQIARILEKTNNRSQRELVARLNGLKFDA